jgi:thioesterase domain-containing protein/acyl carrier protein
VGFCVGPEVAILGTDGQFLGAGAEGEILVRGPSVMRGYAHNPEANAKAFLGDWFRTGDLGRKDADGHLYITGRIKEMINRGAEKILPYEVEAVLRRHPMVEDVAVFGYPHPRLGEDVAAAVVARPGAEPDPQVLRDFAGQYLTEVKVPRRILFLPEIPKGRTGKYQRARLAELLGLADPAPARDPGGLPGLDPAGLQVARIWRELLKVPAIAAGDDFFALGGDSLLAMTMVVQVEKALGCRLDPAELTGAFEFTAFVDLVRMAGQGTVQAQAPAPAVPGVHALRRGGSGMPLFFLHGVYTFQRLVPLLGERNPVYALEPPDEQTLERTRDLSSLVETCLADIRRVRTEGPCLLAGHSMGGLVAFEVARRLLAEGRPVAGVVLLDTDAYGYRPWGWMPRLLTRVQHLAYRAKLQVLAFLKRSPAEWKAYLARRVRAVTHRSVYQAAQRRILGRFQLRPLAVPALLLRCRDEDPARLRRMARRWRATIGPGLVIADVDGDHETVLRPPLIERISIPLRQFLDQVDPA